MQMKRSIPPLFFTVVVLFLLTPQNTFAQSNAPSDKTSQDKMIQELLSEVRQLRIALQRLSVNTYRAQILMERLRLQQEQVNRLKKELSSVKKEISDLKAVQEETNERLDEAERQFDKGLLPDSEVKRLKRAIEEFKRREQGLTERETQLSNELSTEHANLADLNRRMDALEHEMLITGQNDERKGSEKQQ
jgi:peptidoglycan hydrolase CwlO-like protein